MLVSVFEWRRFTEILHVSARPLKIRVEEWNIERQCCFMSEGCAIVLNSTVEHIFTNTAIHTHNHGDAKFGIVPDLGPFASDRWK
jgi:hypothetical protein